MLRLKKSRKAVPPSLIGADVCAVTIEADNIITDHSSGADPLLKAWADQLPDLVALVKNVRQSKSVAESRLMPVNGTRYSLTGIFVSGAVMIVAKDTTVSDRMTEALLESRSLFKGLLDRAVDLSFEVDIDRDFLFVSPNKAFGQDLEGWVGRSADDFFWRSGKVPSRHPLATRTEKTFDTVAVDFGEGQTGWVSFSVEPVFDSDQQFTGVRGVCRDVSDRVAHERQTRMDNLRLGLQRRIVDMVNSIHTSEELLDSASSELMEVLRADMVWSVIRFPEGLVPAAICGEATFLPDIDFIWRQLALAPEPVVEVQERDLKHLAVRLEEADSGIGMLVICRDTATYPWSGQEMSLISDVIGSLAAAFGKAQLINRLERLSSLDELTGIMNRRAFVEATERRLRHQCRSGQSGCLLFVDLDHFKEVNDTLGHKAGDTAIKLVSDTMQTVVRACDIVGRYGGDEFVLWLEDISPADAALKARALIDAMPDIRKKIGAENLGLSASVGVCASVPGMDLKFIDLSERADAALYQVKNAGRSNVALAPLPSQDTGSSKTTAVVGGGV